MKVGLLVVLAMAVLVPSLSEGRRASRCELKQKLGEALTLPARLQRFKNYILAKVICEVERRSHRDTGLVRVFGKRKPLKTTTPKPTTPGPTTPKPTTPGPTTPKPTTPGPTTPGPTTPKPTTVEPTVQPNQTSPGVTTRPATRPTGPPTTRNSTPRRQKREANDEEEDQSDTEDDLEELMDEEDVQEKEEDTTVREEDKNDVNETEEEEEEEEEEDTTDEEEEIDGEMEEEVQEEPEEGGGRRKRGVRRWWYRPSRPSRPWSLGFYGLFQLSDSFYCDSGYRRTRNVCRKECSAFTDDDITDDIACFVKSRAWVKFLYSRHCRPRWNFFSKCE